METIQIISSDRKKCGILTARLEAAGYLSSAGPMSENLRRKLLSSPPDAVILDLDRAPATCRDLGLFLRVQTATRDCLLVFLDGKPDKVKQIRNLLPDACFAASDALEADLEHGLRNKPKNPIIPASVFAGYSGRPLAAKLGVKEGMALVMVNAPDGFETALAPLPEQTRLSRSDIESPDLTLWFVVRLAELEAELASRLQLASPGKIWIIWPKRGSRLESDLTQPAVRQAGLDANWVDFKVCAVDETWTGLCFTARKEK
jgi:hypothetical protein